MTKKNNLKKDEKVVSETEPEGAKEIEQVEEVEEVILAAGAARQRKQ